MLDRNRQSGSVALEFMFLTPLVVVLVYAVIGYSVAFVMLHSLNQLSAEAARSAIAVSTAPGIDPQERDAAILVRINEALAASWLQPDQVRGCGGAETWFDWESDGAVLHVCMEIANPVPAIRLGSVQVPHFGSAFSSPSQVRMRAQ